jgi:hypothetical protein
MSEGHPSASMNTITQGGVMSRGTALASCAAWVSIVVFVLTRNDAHYSPQEQTLPPHNTDVVPDSKLAKTIEEGRPIVEAIYAFKRRYGLWPCDLSEMSPEFLESLSGLPPEGPENPAKMAAGMVIRIGS